jgi:hypothetical protein
MGRTCARPTPRAGLTGFGPGGEVGAEPYGSRLAELWEPYPEDRPDDALPDSPYELPYAASP